MNSSLNARVANNLRRLRAKQKLSQEDAADKCGLHRTYLGAIERGKKCHINNPRTNRVGTEY